MSISGVCTLFRELLEGQRGVEYRIASGRFIPTDGRYRLVDQPESIFSASRGRPYEVEWVEQNQPDGTGPTRLTGFRYEASATVVARLGYLQGGGKDGTLTDVQRLMDEDLLAVRRACEHSANFVDTGVVHVLFRSGRVRFATGDDRRALLDLEFRVRFEDEEPEPST